MKNHNQKNQEASLQVKTKVIASDPKCKNIQQR
jgi:hypothetical protein